MHARGYYLHIKPGECFVGVGIWRPDAGALAKIRAAIVTDSKTWRMARDDIAFRKVLPSVAKCWTDRRAAMSRIIR